MKSAWKKARQQDNSSLMSKSLSFEKSMIKQKDYDTEDKSETFRRSKMDSLTEHLGCESYFHKMRWQWLVYEYGELKHPLDVDRFYHEIKLAIDFGKVNPMFLKIKKDLLKKNGINYVNIESATDLISLAKGLS